MPEIKLETGHEVIAWWDKERDLVVIKVRQWVEDQKKRGGLIVLPDYALPVVPPGAIYPRLNVEWHGDALRDLDGLVARASEVNSMLGGADQLAAKLTQILQLLGQIKHAHSHVKQE